MRASGENPRGSGGRDTGVSRDSGAGSGVGQDSGLGRGTGSGRGPDANGGGTGRGRRGLWARYGDSPLHLLFVLASFALTGYAGIRLLDGDTLGVVLWFVGGAVVHDLVLVPLYSAADRGLCAAFARGRGRGHGGERGTEHGVAAWREQVDYVRVPAFVSLVLLLVWYPLVTERVGHYASYTALEPGGFLDRWLLVTAALFAVSALCLAVRALRAGRGRRGEGVRRRVRREDQ